MKSGELKSGAVIPSLEKLEALYEAAENRERSSIHLFIYLSIVSIH
ncbi:hypothetical protein VCR26J2_350783 [Vibrio coralliirubri]|nr:hypothetical protein VCR26J2_350783 [Vibrio coralliirubri]CDT83505.1 hypothetical protein VCR29J2_690152 [Vibrio coralliirubri]